MDSTQDQDESMIGPSVFKYSVKYQPTQDGIRVFMTGHGDNLKELGDELALYYPQYLKDLTEKHGIKIAPLEKAPKVMELKRAPTKAEKIAELDRISKEHDERVMSKVKVTEQ